REPRTPLQVHMRELTHWMVWIALGFSVLIAFLGWFRGASWRETLLSGLSLAFATIPEELPILITMVIGLGAFRLSREKVILRRLRVAETLGNITVIATDKTGTLTENKISLDKWFIGGRSFSRSEWKHSYWQDLAITIGVLANDGYSIGNSISGNSPNKVIFNGDPTDTAFLDEAEGLGYNITAIRSSVAEMEFPLDDWHKRITMQVQTDSKNLTVCKGAVEQLLTLSTQLVWEDKVIPLTEDINREIQQQAESFASQGYRVIGLCFKEEPAAPLDNAREKAESNLTFLGFTALLDTPRADVKDAVMELQEAGVRTIMITGDHPETARTIANKVGINSTRIIVGRVIDQMSDDELVKRVKDFSIFARTTPEHKLRIVRALQSQGEIVAVTGDGVNDGPALKEGAVGIAMGRIGTDVAKESSDMVIADDRFSSITKAVREGRSLFSNLFKAIRYYLAAKVALIFITFLAAAFGFPIPFTPIQIIVLELFMDIGASTSFPAEQSEADVMKRPPRDSNKPLMDREMLSGIFLGGVSLGIAVLVNYFWSLTTASNVSHAQTLAFATWMIGHLILAVHMRSLREPITYLGILSNKTMVLWMCSALVFVFVVLNVSALRALINLQNLDLNDWIMVISLPFISTVWMELQKRHFWRNKKLSL
nr:cation-transporting P-type ATPase [Desulfitobacterium hafniense]